MINEIDKLSNIDNLIIDLSYNNDIDIIDKYLNKEHMDNTYTGFFDKKTIYKLRGGNNDKDRLLAPAGNLEKLKFAYLYGADACYIGGRDFSLRANAKNFSIEEINEACSYAHNLGRGFM